MSIDDKIYAWVDKDPPPEGTVFSGRRVTKLLLALFILNGLGVLPIIILQSIFPSAPIQKPVEAGLTMEDLDEADQQGQLGSGFKRILDMRKQQTK
jgi:hypothetical protein